MTVGEALAAAEVEPREARILLAAASGFSEASLLAFPERELPIEVEDTFFDYVNKRETGWAVAHIVGYKEFYSLKLSVNQAVLIPRPETELLVDLALERKPSTILDLGTGSGAIALAIKKNLPRSQVTAVEASSAALVVAQRNAAKHSLDIEFLHGQWLTPIGARCFDLIVSNPPYVAEGDPHLAELRHEPRSALVAGADGLDAIRQICSTARPRLNAGGWLLLEHGMGQDTAVRQLLERAGLESVTTWPDLAGIPRVSGGKA